MTPHLQAIRYTASELLAFTALKLFPGTQLLSGGCNELGFYYDFVIPHPIDPHFLILIEEAMRGNAKECGEITEREMMRENAADFFTHRGQHLKAELIAALPYNVTKLVEFNGFFDHAPPYLAESTDVVNAFKIIAFEHITYFTPERGHFPAVRFFGNAFHDKQQLKRFNKLLKGEKEHDHRDLIRGMELSISNASVSSLEESWLPKGASIREILVDLWRKESCKNNVAFVHTPDFVLDDFLTKNEAAPLELFALETNTQETYTPPETPGLAHALLFREKQRSVAELPLRYAEVKKVFGNNEIKTCFAGMLKTRSHTADFTFSFCAPEQLYDELISSLHFIDKMVTILGFRCQWNLCSQGTKYAGIKKQWDHALDLMHKALETCGFDYLQDPNDTCFVGPKIEARLLDIVEREWPGPEVAIDFHLPAKLGLQYSKEDRILATPLVVRRSIFGPLERLVALLIEKDGGFLPLWLAPEQVRIIAVDDSHHAYAKNLLSALQQADIRATCDLKSTPLGARIHDVECAKVPYALIVGDKEEKEKIVNVRQCGHPSTSQRIPLEAFLRELQNNPTFSIPKMVK